MGQAKYDWEAIERLYRAGQFSIREIAKQQHCSEGAIRKKAKKFGWERDLTEKVRQKVRNELVRKQVRILDPQTEKEIVDEAANTQIEVVRSHRKSIKKGRKAVETLLSQLLEIAENREALQDAAGEEHEEDKNTHRYNSLMKVLALPSNASVAVSLSTALKTIVSLERQAFGIESGGGSNEEDVVKVVIREIIR